MRNQISLDTLRRNPTEWHRRGLTHPAEIDAMVAARIDDAARALVPANPSYADFFVAV